MAQVCFGGPTVKKQIIVANKKLSIRYRDKFPFNKAKPVLSIIIKINADWRVTITFYTMDDRRHFLTALGDLKKSI
jgi:hypothetical protein